MNDIQIFNYGYNPVRVIEKDGLPWFVAKDVCDVLEIKNSRDAVSALDNDEKMTVDISDGHSGQRGGAQFLNTISESGLYTLIMRSSKPQAKAFRKWVTGTVLPAILRTGYYEISNKAHPELPAGVLEGAKLIFESAGIKDNQLTIAMDNVYKSYTGRSALAAGDVQLIAPQQTALLTPTEIGQELGLTPRRVNEILAGAGYQYRIGKSWEPLEPGKPFAVMLDTGKKHSNGTPVRQLKWNSEIINVMKNFEELI